MRAGYSYFQRSGTLISKGFACGSSVKMKCFPHVWWLLSLNCLLLLSYWVTKAGFCGITFQQGIEAAGEGGGGGWESFSQKYRKHELPKGTVLVRYCASAHSVCHSTGSMGFLECVCWLRLCGASVPSKL